MTQGFLFKECQHDKIKVVAEKRSSIHFAKKLCADCKKFLGWVPKPETVARQKHRLWVLAALIHKPLSEWERNFVRTIAAHKNISPKQQKLLDQMWERYTKEGGAVNDSFNGEAGSPDRNLSDPF